MMAAMRHPNVVLFLGICIESPSLVTEYCARGSLYEVIQQWTRGKEVPFCSLSFLYIIRLWWHIGHVSQSGTLTNCSHVRHCL